MNSSRSVKSNQLKAKRALKEYVRAREGGGGLLYKGS